MLTFQVRPTLPVVRKLQEVAQAMDAVLGAVQTRVVGFLEMATLLAWSAFPEVQWLDRAAGGGRSTAL